MQHFKEVGCLRNLHVAYSQLQTSQLLHESLSVGGNGAPNLPNDQTPPLVSQAPPLVNQTPPLVNQAPPLSGTTPLRYVQDLMRLNWKELGAWLVEDGGYVYVCG